MKCYLYDANASDVNRLNPRIHSFTKEWQAHPPMLEIVIVLNEKDMEKAKWKGEPIALSKTNEKRNKEDDLPKWEQLNGEREASYSLLCLAEWREGGPLSSLFGLVEWREADIPPLYLALRHRDDGTLPPLYLAQPNGWKAVSYTHLTLPTKRIV